MGYWWYLPYKEAGEAKMSLPGLEECWLLPLLLLLLSSELYQLGGGGVATEAGE
jgi:hypothetical protein